MKKKQRTESLVLSVELKSAGQDVQPNYFLCLAAECVCFMCVCVWFFFMCVCVYFLCVCFMCVCFLCVSFVCMYVFMCVCVGVVVRNIAAPPVGRRRTLAWPLPQVRLVDQGSGLDLQVTSGLTCG